MIFPFFSGILSFSKAPVTWMIFLVNFIVYLVTSQNVGVSQVDLEKIIINPVFSETQGYVFAQYIDANRDRYPASLHTMAAAALRPGEQNKKMLLGGMSLRDDNFLDDIDTFEFKGDPILIGWWREQFEKVQNIRKEHPSYNLGVTKSKNNLEQWLSYQFSHSGMSHFAGNMIFLLLFGSQLELVIGGVGLLVSYLISGIFAALAFLYFNQASAIPLIGASGAVSGVMAMLSVVFWNRGVKYIFFLLIPKRGYAGFVFLPAWVTLILWLLSDFAGYLSTPSELGGVAYSAHLGGELCGAIMGFVFLLICRVYKKEINEKTTGIEIKPIFTTQT